MNKEENELFNFIYPDSNDLLSNMSALDLQYFLYLLNNYYLELRDTINLGKRDTFGLELEFEYASLNQIKTELRRIYPDGRWHVKDDATLFNGGEIATPILKDRLKDWETLDYVCNLVSTYAEIGRNSGGHIHVGSQVLGSKEENWLKFLKLWMTYENIIFRFAYGEALNPRAHIDKFAAPIADLLNYVLDNYKKYKGTYDLSYLLSCLRRSRKQAVNFYKCIPSNHKMFDNTIEFRCPNGTLNPVIWQNNVNLFIKLLHYSKSIEYDEDTVNKRSVKINSSFGDLRFYNQICLDEALEFADLIFDNNLDKTYFLRQYLKSFKVAEQNEKQENAKVFVKTKK